MDQMQRPKCPHCGVEMKKWRSPANSTWGASFHWVCFNDDCPLYRQGWDHIEENYAHKASYRCMNYPGTRQFEIMPVYSNAGGTGQIIDEQAIAEQAVLKEAIKRGFSILADCYVSKDGPAVLKMLRGFQSK